jgi:hypothetical protein
MAAGRARSCSNVRNPHTSSMSRQNLEEHRGLQRRFLRGYGPMTARSNSDWLMSPLRRAALLDSNAVGQSNYE